MRIPACIAAAFSCALFIGCSGGGGGSSSTSSGGSTTGSGSTTGGSSTGSSGGSTGGSILVGNCNLVGSWNVTLSASAGGVSGTAVVGADHVLTSNFAGNTGTESFTISGDQISLTDTGGFAVCPSSEVGVYTVTFAGDCNSFNFALVNDPCNGSPPDNRAQTIDGASFTRQ